MFWMCGLRIDRFSESMITYYQSTFVSNLGTIHVLKNNDELQA